MLLAQISDRPDVMALYDENGRFHSYKVANDPIEAIQNMGNKIFVTTNGSCRKLAMYEVTSMNQVRFINDKVID